jgi:glycosyltransferase involved in cell wall biosynthesis
MLLVDSLYVHNSGGKTLLEYLLNHLEKYGKKYFVLFDERIDSNVYQSLIKIEYKIIKAKESSRKEFYINNINKFSSIFCFSNVPPPVSISNIPVYIYFHNSLLISNFFEYNGYKFHEKILFFMKRLYIFYLNNKLYNWIVQTDFIKKDLIEKLCIKSKTVHTIPFFIVSNNEVTKIREYNTHRFLYVADGVKQKNHNKLLDAFELLFNEGYNPGLVLTIPASYKTLNSKVKYLQTKGVSILNVGIINKNELIKLYSQTEFLIFPSLTESFGLPLIESTMHGCKVISADLPYTYQVIKPTKTFNPFDVKSITVAIKDIICSNELKPTEIVIKNKITLLINTINNE